MCFCVYFGRKQTGQLCKMTSSLDGLRHVALSTDETFLSEELRGALLGNVIVLLSLMRKLRPGRWSRPQGYRAVESGEEGGEMCLGWEPCSRGFEYAKSFHLHSHPLRSESDDRLGEMHTLCPRSKTQGGMGWLSPKPIPFYFLMPCDLAQVTLPPPASVS